MLESDVVFATIGDRELRLDLVGPEGVSVPTRTAVLMVHGGGWVQGERGMLMPLAGQLAALGFLAVPVEYRLVPEAPWPAQRDDVVAAARWVADNAGRLGIDPDRIVLLGCSAGGHLAMMATAAIKGKGIAAIISLFTPGQLGLGQQLEKGLFDGSMLLGPEAGASALSDASPLNQITADFPPVFLLHGGRDWLIDPVSSIRLYDKLQQAGVTAELHIVANAHHEFSSEPAMQGPVAAEIALFLNRIVIEPDRCAAEAEASNIFAQGPEAFQAMVAQMMSEKG